MLEPNKEILIAKIIGLLNGLDGEGVSFKEENMLRSALDAIKNNRDLTKYITFFDEKKREYLPNCLTCQSPCGRSNDYYINKMVDLDAKYESIINNTSIAVIKSSAISTFFKKIKAILTSEIELQ